MMYLDSMTLNDIVTGITGSPKRMMKIRKAIGGKRWVQIEKYLCAESAAHRVKLSDEEAGYCIGKVLDHARSTS